jgi:prophage antirepressor-like protein
MNELQIFKNNRFGEVRVATTENNEPLFCLADVCKILDIQTGATKNRLNEKGISLINTPTSSGNQNMIFVDEPNFYKAVFQSRKPEAEAFTEWVTSEVLPSIRKHGAYMNASVIEKALTDPDTIIQLATNLKEERRQREILQQKSELQNRVIEQNAPKVEYFEEVLQSESTYTTTQVAKELGMGAPTLNRKLNERRVQYKQNGTWVLYEKYQNKGYTKTKTHTYNDNGVQKTAMQTVWTEKGRLFIHSLLNINTNGKIKSKELWKNAV